MSNLVPEKRVNKNGIAVTKHVRPDSNTRSVSLPPINAVPAQRRLQTPLLDESIFLGDTTRANLGIKSLSFTLDDLEVAAVARLEELLKADDALRPRSYVIQSGIIDATRSDTLEQCIKRMHNIAVFGETVTASKADSIVGYVSGLENYPESVLQRDVDYLLESEPEATERAKSLLKFTIAANKALSDTLVYDSFMDTLDSESGIQDLYIKLNDDDLALYVADHPERSDDVLRMLEQEGSTLPVAILDARFNHEVQSMRDGVL